MEFLISLFSPAVAATMFGLLSGVVWGAGDFNGGLASRRGGVFGTVLFAYVMGAIFLAGVGLILGEPPPPASDLIWAAGAGISGGIGITALYASLAAGSMGINAPVSAVLGAALPVTVGILLEGTPDAFTLVGLGLALIAVWLISRPAEVAHEMAEGAPRGLWLALLAGAGFGGFFIMIDRLQGTSVFLSMALARSSAVPLIAGVALINKQALIPKREAIGLALLAGVLDALGNLFFAIATQVGELAVATVLASLYPFSTAILAWVFLKERLTRVQTGSILLALIAIVMIAL